MKIVFVDQISTVNNKYSFSLLDRLCKDNEIIFISDEKKYEENNVKSYDFFKGTTNKNRNKLKKTTTYIKAWKNIYKICKNEKIDVLHVQWFILSPIDSMYIKKIKNLGVKIIVTVHDILPFNEKFYDYTSHKSIYDSANHIIVQAKPNVDRINDMFENILDKVIYIPHGNFVEHVKLISKNKARELLGISNDSKVILFFGQIKKVKGLDILIKAFKELIKDNKDENLLLLIAGKVWEDEFSNYEKIMGNIGSENVRCDIKYIPDEEISWYYCAADINVLPYREVYQSGVVHLACAYEKAVIATNVGSFPEVIKDGETGILIEKDDYIALKEALETLIFDEDKILSMGEKGKKHIEENFSWDKISEDILTLYNY